jgi:hypothetical protein
VSNCKADDEPAVDQAGGDQHRHQARADPGKTMERRMQNLPALRPIWRVGKQQDQEGDERADPDAGRQGVEDVAAEVQQASRTLGRRAMAHPGEARTGYRAHEDGKAPAGPLGPGPREDD